MTQQYTNDQIESELFTAEGGKRLPWGKLGRLLDEVERSGYWKGDSGSFTEWLKKHADRLGAKEGTLWRYLSAGRSYNQFREKYPMFFNLPAPPLEEVNQSVSPENIELLSKLSRVLPEEMITPVVRNVLSGRTTRGDLRDLWQTYRPVLAGRTARGRGVEAPQLDTMDSEQKESLSEAMAVDALLRAGEGWTGNRGLKNYLIYPHVEIKYSRSKMVIDAVAVTRQDDQSPLLFHGIDVVSKRKPVSPVNIGNLDSLCDLTWLLSSDPDCELKLPDIPNHVGIMVVQNMQIKRFRPAQHEKHMGSKSVDLAKTLLLKSLGR